MKHEACPKCYATKFERSVGVLASITEHWVDGELFHTDVHDETEEELTTASYYCPICGHMWSEKDPPATPYLWLRDGEQIGITSDGVKLVASYKGAGPAIFIKPEVLQRLRAV